MICLYVTRWVNLDYIPEKMENILERVNRENKTSHSCVIGRDKAGSFQELSINQGIKHTESLEDMHVVSLFMEGIYFTYD